MSNTLNLGTDGNWAVKKDSLLGYNSENGNFKPLPFDFTRASSATVVNKDGLIEIVGSGEPRIDFKDDAKGALLLEPQRTNLITYSEDFSQTSFWNANSNVTILKNYKSPNGTLNASKIIPNTTNSQHSIKATSKLTNSRYNYTVYVKASGNSFFQIANQSTSDYVNFNLNNGTYFASNSNDEVSVDYFGDGWYRCNVYFTTTFQGIYNVIIENIGSTRLESFVGNDVDGIYIWGAQAEQGSYATSYIPTQGAISTKVAETCSQTPPSGIIKQTEGTLFVEFPNINNTFAFIGLTEGGNANRMVIFSSGDNILIAQFRQLGDIKLQNSSGIINGSVKASLSFSSTESVFYVNGVQIGVGTASAWSSLNEITFNQADQIGAKVSQIKYYNTRLSNTELQALTS